MIIMRLPGICLLLLCISFRLYGIDASVAHALFFRPEVNAYGNYSPEIDIYWQINPKSLHFITTAQKTIVAQIKTDIVFTNENGIVQEDHFILQTSSRSNPDELSALNILELKKYNLPIGSLKVRFTLTDVNDTTSKFYFNDSVNTSYIPASPFYSAIQLIDTSFSSGAVTPFARKGRQQIPLCANFLDDNKRWLHYYAEMYGMQTVPPDHFPLVQKIRVSKKLSEAYIDDMNATDTFKSAVPVTIAGSFPISRLVSGNYYLTITLEDKNGTVIASRSQFFQRLNINPEKIVVAKKSLGEVMKDTAMENLTVLNLDKTFVAKFTLPQIKAILKMLLPVSDPMQVSAINNFIKKPDEMYMRYYIYNFFLDQNKKDPGKAWKEYSEKVKGVNKKYTEQGTAGYETDRGFIYLRYGPPSDVVTVSSETGAMPYEIWQYNTLTQFSNKKEVPNALFLFFKPARMMSSYRLLHSTVPGEMINMSWRLYLYANTNGANSSGINTNSRAEQYFGNR